MFSSNRIYLRKVELGDTELYQSWRNDVDVMYSTNPSLDVYSYEDTRSFVENVLVNSNTSKSYIIVERNGETPIGITSLINMDYKNRNAECIIDLGNKQYWGKGYAKEALTLLLNYAFMELNLHRVSLKVFDFNEAAIQLYQKLGFKEEGRAREALYRNGKWYDVIHMGLLKDEFNN
ncbi:RimJ/RimL family protein N-acetyltransferase [Alkalibacillus filiformis]|uniref:RimJ/RimL family protein N-acetyltransferase n=1 Tax=Alkalibacillus filiformis TaxID=200990 RepID=A0ABU0DTV8_9BACI|nr:GNAT family protein [Alkalibacillus filiformis]MDQ0351899.1 RimJ/RimL family protein N-acetyltransferase [Alkalibacillus filiformis]